MLFLSCGKFDNDSILVKPCIIGAIPVLNEVMSAARGATYAFSGVTGHVNNSVSQTLLWNENSKAY